MNLEQWAIDYQVPYAAVVALRALMGLNGRDHMPEKSGVSEAAVDSVLVLEAARLDIPLWRNNCGALRDEGGRLVRYGLANSTKDENKLIASADRIGIRRRLITPALLGQHIGQFVSRETKKVGWVFAGGETREGQREEAQLRWAQLILSYGGDAGFCTGEGTFV